jgi:glutamate/tyrosine decarboxylase-like PLP-dependent enzyme
MLLTGPDCSNMWVKDKMLLVKHLSQKSSYFTQDNDTDFKNWTIHLNRDCKALKAWFVIQAYGEVGIREHLRKFVEAGKAAEEIVKSDSRLEMVVKRLLSLVVFRVKGDNEKTDNLVRNLLQDEKIYIFGSKLYGKSIIRFTPGSYLDGNENINEAFKIILGYLD